MNKLMKANLVNAFWHLPYNVRRKLFHVLRPNTYAFYQSLRNSKNGQPRSLRAFDQYKCIFVHIPKTAGISIRESLFSDLQRQHISIRNFQLIFEKEEFENYFKFAFIRNPYDRLVSAYFFLKKGGRNTNDSIWAEKNLSLFSDFESFVKGWINKRNIYSYVHFFPQCHFICDVNGQILVNFLGRFENLEKDFLLVADTLQIDTTLQKINLNKNKRGYHSYYSEETKQIVEKVYAEDFQKLGYSDMHFV